MSTTQGIDARSSLIGWTNGLVGMYTADINAIPEDKWSVTHGGCTQSAQALTADALTMMQWCTKALQGDTSCETYGDDMAALATKLATRQDAVDELKSTAEAFCAALGAASDEALNSMVTPPWQLPAPLYTMAQIASSHLWYHDGQLNYIQCLLGDEKVHWLGD